MATQTKTPAAKKAGGRFSRTSSTPMASSLVLVARTKLTVRDGFNPRTKTDEVELDGLAQSIIARGLLTPLLVASTSSGFELIAGHRRVAAVDRAIADGALAKDVTLPAFLRDRETELHDAVAENFNRVDLSPLEEARAFGRLRDGGLTPKGISEAVGVAQRRVTERLRILDLPAKTQEHFHTGKLSVQIAKPLADLVAFDRRLCDLVVTSILSNGGGGGRGDIGYAAWHAVKYGAGTKGELVAIGGTWGGPRIDAAKLGGSLPQELDTKVRALEAAASGQYMIALDQAAIDTLNANGVLFIAEKNGSSGRGSDREDYMVCRDRVALRGVCEPTIERDYKALLKRQAQARRDAGQPGSPQAAAAAERATKEDEKARQYRLEVAARGYNLKLGEVLFKHYMTVELTADVITFLAITPSLVENDGSYQRQTKGAQLFLAGLRYIDPRYQDESTVKSTGRSKVKYLTDTDAPGQKFAEWWTLASTPQEIAGRTLVAYAAAVYARQDVVSASHRVHRGHAPYGETGEQAWAASFEQILPPSAALILKDLVAKRIPKWEPPDERTEEQRTVAAMSTTELSVLTVFAGDGASIGASEQVMLDSVVRAISPAPTRKDARAAIVALKKQGLLAGVMAGGMGITDLGVRVAKAAGAKIGQRAARKSPATSEEGAAEEAAPERRVMVAPASDIPNGQAKLARLMPDRHPSNPTGLRKVIYVDSKTAAWVAASRILDEKPASRDPQKASAATTRRQVCLDHIKARPGITIPEIAEAMELKQNYLYRLLPALEQDGRVRKEGRGWFPVGADPETAKQVELNQLQQRVLLALMQPLTGRGRTENLLAKQLPGDVRAHQVLEAIASLTEQGLLATDGGKAPYVTKQGGEVAAAITKAAKDAA